MKKSKRSSWRHPIRDRVKRRRRLLADDSPKKETREARQNFEKKHTRQYENTPKGIMLRKQMYKRRAKNKVAKKSRKVNR